MGVISARRAGRWERVGRIFSLTRAKFVSPLSQRGARGDLATVGMRGSLNRGLNVRPACLAGGARQRPTFFARAKKVGKESTPRFRRNPEAANLERAAKELALRAQTAFAGLRLPRSRVAASAPAEGICYKACPDN